MDYSLPGSFIHGIFPGKITAVGCHFLLVRSSFVKKSTYWYKNWKNYKKERTKNSYINTNGEIILWYMRIHYSVQFSSVTQSCPTLCDPLNCSMPGLPVHHQLPEFTQTHVHRVCDAIQPSHPLSSPFPPAPNPSQHQSLFQWVNSSHEVAKELEFQL